MHEAALARAALPTPTAILGLPMRPYSLGHELWLIRESNPLAVGGGVVTPAHLCEAALICANTWEENQRFGSWWDRVKLAIWHARNRRTTPARYQAEIAAFRAYRAAGATFFPEPDRMRPGTAPREPGSPEILRLHQFLVTRLNQTAGAAWDYPYGLGVMQWQAWHETEGAFEVYNRADADFDQFIAAEEAKEGRTCPA